jgi:DNA-binding CsgD family transcriptional regulator/tetratricopeptide (TPR) repeat protein
MSVGLVSPVFVGRHAELAEIQDVLGQAAEGRPGCLLVGGEAGIGKTRLIEEAGKLATAEGVRVITGHCVQLSGGGLPFAPLIDALRQLLRTMPADELDAALGIARPHLARLLPGLESSDAAGLTDSGMPGSALLEMVLGVLERLSTAGPVLFVIEDAHWADQSTRELVAYLVQALRDVPVVVLITYRSDEMHRRHPLRPLLTTWDRLRSVRRIELRRFDRDEVAAQLSAILGCEPDAALVDTVFGRSEGTPFLVEEILGSSRAGGDVTLLPPSMRDLLLTRLDALSSDAQRVLRAASVAGRAVPERLLIATSGLEQSAAFTALREAVENQLLVVDDTGSGYSFRHALARDAVYDDMLPGERVQLHAVYGETLAARPELSRAGGQGVAADLAYHWYAALDLPKALGASVDAAGQAADAYAPAEALAHLERALQIWPRVSDAEALAGCDEVELFRRAAGAAYQSGAVDRSLALLNQGLERLGPDAAPERRALLMERRARALSDLGRNGAGISVLRDALSQLDPDATTTARAAVLATLAQALARSEDAVDAERVAEQAIAVAQAVGATQQEAEARITLGTVAVFIRDAEVGIAALRSGVALARTGNHYFTALRGLINLTDTLERSGRSIEAEQVALEGIELADQAGLKHVVGTYLVGNLCESLMHQGRWHEAEERLGNALATPAEGIFGASLLELRGAIAAGQGRYDKAEQYLTTGSRLNREQRDSQYTQAFAFTFAELARVRGDYDAAAGLVRDELARQADVWSARYSWPLIWQWARVTADRAIWSRDRRRTPDPVEPELLSVLERLEARTPGMRAYQALALAELSRVTGDTDRAVWQAAVDAVRPAELAQPLGSALLHLADAQCTEGDRDAGAATAGEALRLAEQLGAVPLVEAVKALVTRARLTLAPDGSPGEDLATQPDPAAGASPDTGSAELERIGLTQREREILGLLAAGRTNPQIARALYISPKTASVHVSNILTKLGVSSRVEAAGWAQRLGLAEPADQAH